MSLLLRTCWQPAAAHCMDKSCASQEWVMCRVWTSHVPRMNESCHTHSWIMFTQIVYFVTTCGSACCMDESGHTQEWVMSRIYISDVTHKRIMSHTQTNHVRCAIHRSAACSSAVYGCVKSYTWMSHVAGAKWVMSRVQNAPYHTHE